MRRNLILTTPSHRLRSVKRVLDGYSAVEVGRRYGDSSRAVAYWVTRFKAHGVKGLEVSPRSGRPSKLTSSQMKQVRRFVRSAETNSKKLTGHALAAFVKEQFRVPLTRQHGRRILKKIGT